MTTGLVTYHAAPNFGAFLQAWSMVQVLVSFGCDVRVLDYQSPNLGEKYRRQGLRRWLPSLGRMKMRRFMRANLPLSGALHGREEVGSHVRAVGYETLVCGSDQIWMKGTPLGFDPVYHLDVDGPESMRRVAYAPSCGSMNSYGDDEARARVALGKLDAISVRDANSAAILGKLGFPNTPLVVDPTLLADFTPILNAPAMGEEYLAVAGPTDGAAEVVIRKVADALNLRVVAVGARCGAADLERPFVDPGEWLSWIAHAGFVVSSLFHGTAISLRFRRPFLSVDSAGRGFKISELLQRFGLVDRFLERDEGGQLRLPDELLVADYSQANERIEAECRRSREYLRTALHG